MLPSFFCVVLPPNAQRLALPSLAAFVRSVWGSRAKPMTASRKNNGFADFQVFNLQNEEASGRNPGRHLAKHISLEPSHRQPGAFPPSAQSLDTNSLEPSRQQLPLPSWEAMNLQMQKLQVFSLLALHKSAVCCL